MRDLKTFQEKIETYRKIAPTPRTQKELAEAIPLDKDELSKRLNAYKHPNRNISPLSCTQVQAIVRVLTRWGAIETQEQAKDLLDLMECSHFSASDWRAYPLNLLRSAPPPPSPIKSIPGSIEMQRKAERLARLRAMQADHSGFLRNRLDSFVGRQIELTEIHQHIDAMLPMGGYITITGQPGQGKSSIIAKLVHEYGPEKTAHHFIPFNPGPDYQVSLLRDLMAQLILKHDLSDLYVLSENRPILRDYFLKVLTELVEKGGQEVIFIDGLDQLKEDANGERDLSFLPSNPPVGVIFILGTRPNDTLRPLELGKPYYEYALPNMSRQDFDLILDHRRVKLSRLLADEFYRAMQANVLYLDLVAKELAQAGTAEPEEIVKRVAVNPENIFSLSIARLKRHTLEWREVLKPILGTLLVAQEALSARHIRQILGIGDDRLRDGLALLGGMVADDGRQRYFLFHLKLYDYLRQDESNPHKEYIFATDEEQIWHGTLASWCERGNTSIIWQDVKHDLIEQGRREYARRYCITHLYYAQKWQQLFEVLDDHKYGWAKLSFDPGMHTYIQDLDFGREAAAGKVWTLKESIALLPRLWRYTLLQYTLVSQADSYPFVALRLLVLLNQEEKAIGLAALSTNLVDKVNALLAIAKQIGERPGGGDECIQLLLRTYEVAFAIKKSDERAEALSGLGIALAQAQQWEPAETIIQMIEVGSERAEALSGLGIALAQAQQWERAEIVIRTIEVGREKVRALCELGKALSQVQQWDQAHVAWTEAESTAYVIKETHLRNWALSDLGAALAQAQQWEPAKAVIRMIGGTYERTRALRELGAALAQAQQWEPAKAIISTINEANDRAGALSELGVALAQAGQWEQAEAVWTEAETQAWIYLFDHDDVFGFDGYHQLVRVLARAQQWERAQTVIQMMEAGKERVRALSELGVALAQAGQWEQAEAVWIAAETVIRKLKERGGEARALYALGIALAQAQQWERAETVIRTIEENGERAEALCDLGLALARVDQWERAKSIWTDAKTTASTIAGDWQQVGTLRELGLALTLAGQWEPAKAIWIETEVLISTIKEPNKRTEALRVLWTALIEAQQWERAEAVIQTIEADREKTKALCELAVALVQVNQWERAEAVIRGIDWGDERLRAIEELGIVLAQTQQWEQIETAWKRAEAVAHTLQDIFQRVWSLLYLQIALVRMQQWKQVETFFHTIGESGEEAGILNELRAGSVLVHPWERSEAAIRRTNWRDERAKALQALGVTLNEVDSWERSEAAIRRTNWRDERTEALQTLRVALASTHQLEQDVTIVYVIENNRKQAEALYEAARDLARADGHKQLLRFVQRSWQQANTREFVIELLPLVTGLIPLDPEIGISCCEALSWVDTFLKG